MRLSDIDDLKFRYLKSANRELSNDIQHDIFHKYSILRHLRHLL